ncbi:hypothetical protein HGA92_02200 [Candidatus Gracilibacteria bacterium]|nr:hypothetical protein [Candidatus Gracilibacteria bacterium]
MQTPQTIQDYISQFPQDIQIILENIKKLISETNPQLTQSINYGIPTFKHKGKNFVHFGAFKDHIGFFPGPKTIEKFKSDLQDFKISKGTIQFSLDKKIPYDLIQKIVDYKNKEEAK